MLNVKQFLYSKDNLGYLVYGKKEAVAIDGGAPTAILSFLREKNLTLTYVANTHSHPDHVPGNSSLVRETTAKKLSPNNLIAMENIELEGEKIRVVNTPGHSYDSVSFYFGNTLLSGDTLFIGIIGKCFTGNLKLYFSSIKLLCELPGNTVVYPGHDYVLYALKKAKKLEPYNDDIDFYLAGHYDPKHVRSTLEWERKINPCLRYNNEKLRSTLEEMGMKADSAFECFKSVREYL